MGQLLTRDMKYPCGINEEHLDTLTVKFFSHLGLNNYIKKHENGMDTALNDYNKNISDLSALKELAEKDNLKLEKDHSILPRYEYWHQHFADYISYIKDIIEIKKEQISTYST